VRAEKPNKLKTKMNKSEHRLRQLKTETNQLTPTIEQLNTPTLPEITRRYDQGRW